MKVFYMYDGYRTLEEKSIKATFSSIKDLEVYWLKKNEEYIKNGIGTQEEAVEVTNKTVQEISSKFQEGDEIIYFSDFGIAPERCEREFLLVKRGNNLVKTVLVRMS